MQRQIRRKRSDFWFRVVPVILLIGVFFWWLDGEIRPALESFASHQARVYATRWINDAMMGEMENPRYDTLVNVTQNAAGEVTSIQTDMAEVRRLQTRLTATILDSITQERQQTVQIPIGTLLGNQLLSGHGPKIEVRLVPTNAMETRITNDFVSAGINQTLHRILLEIEIEVRTIFPGYRVNTTTVTHYPIAETVIVGKVPEGYTQINGDDSSIISKINDYKQ